MLSSIYILIVSCGKDDNKQKRPVLAHLKNHLMHSMQPDQPNLIVGFGTIKFPKFCTTLISFEFSRFSARLERVHRDSIQWCDQVYVLPDVLDDDGFRESGRSAGVDEQQRIRDKD